MVNAESQSRMARMSVVQVYLIFHALLVEVVHGQSLWLVLLAASRLADTGFQWPGMLHQYPLDWQGVDGVLVLVLTLSVRPSASQIFYRRRRSLSEQGHDRTSLRARLRLVACAVEAGGSDGYSLLRCVVGCLLMANQLGLCLFYACGSGYALAVVWSGMPGR